MSDIDTSNWRLEFDQDKHPRSEPGEGHWWLIDGMGDDEVTVAEILEHGLDVKRHKARAEFILRACKSYKALMALAETIRSIRDEQASDAIFGGQTSKERRSNSQIYAGRISAEAAKIDDLLSAIFPAPDESDEAANETR